MEHVRKEKQPWNFWRFMVISGLISSPLYSLFAKMLETDRMPLGYYFLSGLISVVLTSAIIFLTRNWPERWKTNLTWLIVVCWIVACVALGRL